MNENFSHLDELGLTHTIIFCTSLPGSVSGPQRVTGSSAKTYEGDHWTLFGDRNQKTNMHYMETLCQLVFNHRL